MPDDFNTRVIHAGLGELTPRETPEQKALRRQAAVEKVRNAPDAPAWLREEAARDLETAFAQNDSINSLISVLRP